MFHSKQREKSTMNRKILLGLLVIGVMTSWSDAFLKSKPKTKTRQIRSGVDEGVAEWTIVTYIQADNNLDYFAYHNINDMQTVSIPDNVNVLVQWDQPDNDRTWRYKIVEGGRIEDASLTIEMGINPKQELIDMAQWTKDKYPAKHYAIILWNHGAGVIDYKSQKLGAGMSLSMASRLKQVTMPWLEIPGLKVPKGRGILYDDTQGTFMNNQDLAEAFATISNQVYGKKVDIVGMDACLMAMLEVGYQIRNYADYFVASEENEPGEGWSYSGFLNLLCADPSACGPRELAAHIVNSYGEYYKSQINYYTQSAMQLDCLEKIKKNIDRMIYFVERCPEADSWKIKDIIKRARRDSVVFEDDYIDLHSFYQCMFQKTRRRKASTKSAHVELVDENVEIEQEIAELADFSKDEEKELEEEMLLRGFKVKRMSYAEVVNKLRRVLASGMRKIRNAVTANIVGYRHRKARGISIYYPRDGRLHNSYYKTNFALDSNWVNFIKKYK